MAKTFYGVRFEPLLHSSFKAIALASGCTVTGAFERFMRSCVEAGSLVFVEKDVLDFEAEARVLVDWLCKGKCFFRNKDGEEVNIQGRLLSILPRVGDVVLKREIEASLKQSVSLKE